jgi:predicted AAA+ superfamily ATPase
MGPLSPWELQDHFDLRTALRLGLLPGVYLSDTPKSAEKLLRSYSATYLREEVQAESLTRNIEGFSRFFEVCASRSGDWMDFSKFGSQAMIQRVSAQRYFEILVDTLVVYSVEPFAKSAKRRIIQHPRFFYFDVGALNGALGNFSVSADRLGSLFEHLVLQSIKSTAAGYDQEVRISGYRTEAGAEVDFIVETGGRVFAVEVKASANVGKSDLRGLQSFAEFYGKKHQPMVVYTGTRSQVWDGVEIMDLPTALNFIFSSS